MNTIDDNWCHFIRCEWNWKHLKVLKKLACNFYRLSCKQKFFYGRLAKKFESVFTHGAVLRVFLSLFNLYGWLAGETGWRTAMVNRLACLLIFLKFEPMNYGRPSGYGGNAALQYDGRVAQIHAPGQVRSTYVGNPGNRSEYAFRGSNIIATIESTPEGAARILIGEGPAGTLQVIKEDRIFDLLLRSAIKILSLKICQWALQYLVAAATLTLASLLLWYHYWIMCWRHYLIGTS